MVDTIVFGTYRFLGYHLCNYFLEKGNQVIGIDFDSETEDQDEKELIFGRNSNFSYCSINEGFELNEDRQIQVYCSLYDYLKFGYEENVSMLMKSVKDLIISIPIKEITVLLPLNMDGLKEVDLEGWRKEIELLSLCKWIYIPEIYGPWLPEISPLQVMMQTKTQEETIDISRLIFIDDLLLNWKKILALKEKEVAVIGEVHKDWREQYSTLTQTDMEAYKIVKEHSTLFPQIIIPVKTSLVDGLQALREHNKKLQFLKQWKNK